VEWVVCSPRGGVGIYGLGMWGFGKSRVGVAYGEV
jgi:hypothetical protein